MTLDRATETIHPDGAANGPDWFTRLTGHGRLWNQMAQWRAVLESAPLGCCIIQAEGSLWANRAARALFGAAPADLTGLLALADADGGQALAVLADPSAAPARAVEIAIGDRWLAVTAARLDDSQGDAMVLWFDDVTERRRQAADQARLMAGLDVLSAPLWMRDEAGRIVWVNRSYAEALESPAATVIAAQRELTTNTADEQAQALASAAAAAGKRTEQERYVVIKGDRRLLRVAETPVPGGQIGGAIDVTERDVAVKELARHVAAHADVLEQINVGIAIYGADTRIVFYNSAWCRLYAMEERWLASKPTLAQVLDRMAERRKLPEQADFRRFKQAWLDLFTSLIEPREELLHRQDGSVLRMIVVPHPLGGIMFVSEDVTDRLRLEASYNTLFAVQRETLDNLREAVAVFGTDGRLKLWNPVYRALWDLSEADLLAEPHVSRVVDMTKHLYPPTEDWEEVRGQLVQLVFQRRPLSDRLDRPDGRSLQRSVVPLPDGGVLMTYFDVTDTVRVEAALRERNAALEDADRLKLEFLANISYQLRTPLNAINGFGELLDREMFGPLNPRQHEYTAGILDASHRLMSLIDAILDLSTIEAGYMRLSVTKVDIPKLFAEVRALTEDWARKRVLTVEFDCEAELGPVEADLHRLRQVLMNLISNAIRFATPGGTITVLARLAGDNVEFIVRDVGPGIAESDQARVFDAFFRSGKSGQSGAGVGLALVKRFVELHGGRVMLDSKVGEGTTVACLLPRHSPVQRADNEAWSASTLR